MNFDRIFFEIATSTFFNGRLYVMGQRFLRSVWVNWFENLPQECQINLLIFKMAAWRPSCLKFEFFDFLQIVIKFSLKSLLLLQFPMDYFETRYTYYLGQSSNLRSDF